MSDGTDTNLQANAGNENTNPGAAQQTEGTPAAPAADGATPPVDGATPPADANAAPAAEGQDGATKTADGENKDADVKPGTAFHGAPEADYEAFAAPEGATLNPEVVTTVKGLAKELDLSQAGAQVLAVKADNFVKTFATAQEQVVKQARTEWTTQSKADKEFGGDKYDANMAIVAKARDAFMTPGLKDVLNISGLGDHPEMVRAFYRIGKSISEDKVVVGRGAPAGDDLSRAQRIWPNQK